MQGFEMAGVYTLFGIAAVALRRRIPDLDAAPLAVRVGVGIIVAGVLAAPILMRGTNLIPDRLESTLVAAMLGTLAVLVIWLRR